MKLARIFGTAVVAGGILAAVGLSYPNVAHGTDLLDSATLVAHPSADINDVYLFPSPENPANVVLAMTVNAGTAPAAASTLSFDPLVLYQFKISHTAAATSRTNTASIGQEDTVIQFLADGTGSGQKLTMFGPAKPNFTGASSTVVATTASTKISFNQSTTLTVADNAAPAGAAVSIKAFAGVATDRAFFDLARFYQITPDRDPANHKTGQVVPAPTQTSFAGFASGGNCDSTAAANFFATNGGLKTLALVVEIPKSLLRQVPGSATTDGKPFVHVWGTTSTVSGT